MKTSPLLLLPLLALSLIACGSPRQATKKTASGRNQAAVAKGASASTAAACSAMSVGGGDLSHQIDITDLSGWSACRTNDPHVVEFNYNLYSANGQYCVVSGDGTEEGCFQVDGYTGTVTATFEGTPDTAYMILQKDEPTFGPGSKAAYAYGKVR